MAELDDIKQQAGKFAEAAQSKAAEIAEKANEWASKERPEMDQLGETVSGAAATAVDKVADGANAAYEALKNTAEALTGQDVDGDGQIGTTGAAPGENPAPLETAGKAVSETAGKAFGAAKGFAERITGKDLDGDGEVG